MIVYLQMIETDEDKSKFEEIYQEYRNLMYYVAYKTSLDKGTQRKTTENELPSLTQCTA